MPIDFVELDRRAVLATVDLTAGMVAADLDRATPCAEWTLGDLLAHLIAQHRGFAAAAGGSIDPADWAVRPVGTDPAGSYAQAAHAVLAAFAAAGETMVLPELNPTFRFPAAQAISFHFIDYVVHGWDLARSLDLPYELEPELRGPAVEVAGSVPDGPRRAQPGALFRPRLPVGPDASELDRVLALLGRSPAWPD
jgi:uncharacterized protein (TIGR03086 family)